MSTGGIYVLSLNTKNPKFKTLKYISVSKLYYQLTRQSAGYKIGDIVRQFQRILHITKKTNQVRIFRDRSSSTYCISLRDAMLISEHYLHTYKIDIERFQEAKKYLLEIQKSN